MDQLFIRILKAEWVWTAEVSTALITTQLTKNVARE